MKEKSIGLLVYSLVLGGAEVQALLMAKTIKANSDFKPIIYALNQTGPLEEVLKKEEIEYYILNFNLEKFHKSHFFKLREFIRIGKEFNKQNVKIIIPYTYYPNLVGNIAAFFAGIKKHFWNQVGKEWQVRKSTTEKLSLFLTKYFLSNSFDAKLYIEKYLKKRNKNEILVIPNVFYKRETINCNNWRDKLNIDKGDVVITMLGNLFQVKDHDTAISAFNLLCQKFRNVKLLIVGYAPEINNLYKLKALAFDYSLCEKIKFIDSIFDINGILSTSDIALFTSLKKHSEGSPNVIMDYMLAGLPIVASNIEPLQELFEKLDSRWLYEPENYQDLALKLEPLIIDENLRKNIGNINKEHVIKYHHPNNLGPYLKTIINNF